MKKMIETKRPTEFFMKGLAKKLYPICRSITGDGVRQTLSEIKKIIPLKIKEIPTGTKVFDWEIPQEWNIQDAYVKNLKGERVIDFKKSNLHVVNYSLPVNKTMDLKDLKKNLHTISDKPDSIPYKTSYYEKTWGFCLEHNKLKKLKNGKYKVFIDSSLVPGSLTFGEYVIAGDTKEEILISTHVCHPSLANDNLSGIVVATNLALRLSTKKNIYTYRFLFIPGTIGSIAWLATNKRILHNIKHGLVLTGVGDLGMVTYKKSRRDNSVIDQVVPKILKKKKILHTVQAFSPFGYDERQYCSPGINLPVGTLTRSLHGTYPQYHTSEDNLDFISEKSLIEILLVCEEIMNELERTRITEPNEKINTVKKYSYINLHPKGEPNLGKRGLYKAMSSVSRLKKDQQMALLWVLNLSDGYNSDRDIINKSGLTPGLIHEAITTLKKSRLIGVNYGA